METLFNTSSTNAFLEKVKLAQEKIKTILENNRFPVLPADAPHSYQDKFLLAEYVTRITTAAYINAFEHLGFDKEKLKKMKEWSKKRTVTLKLISEEKCVFDHKEEKEVEAPTKHVTEVSGIISAKVVDKIITKVREFFWNFSVNYQLYCFAGNNEDEKIILQNKTRKTVIITSIDESPRPNVSVIDNLKTLDITWLLNQLSENDVEIIDFKIDRFKKKCFTPRRNEEIADAYQFFKKARKFHDSFSDYFTNLFSYKATNLDLSAINSEMVFLPNFPFLEERNYEESQQEPVGDNSSKLILSSNDFNRFLNEQRRTFGEKFDILAKLFPEDKDLVNFNEGRLLVTVHHLFHLSDTFEQSVDYIEYLLRTQIIAAIGKELTPDDFQNYMNFHNRKLFKPMYEPALFSYAIRRPNYYPEGIISIETELTENGKKTISQPIPTICSRAVASKPMNFTINAATSIQFLGDRYLHSFISHKFSSSTPSKLTIHARARQFSCFILLIGNILSAQLFEPKYAVIVKDKDEFSIPLDTEEIPTPKQFRDAIESLSPEQQSFAKAFRAMQLESSLFAFAVIQIKPQLENVLNLPSGSLTKQIQLNQQLINTFIEYQIPTDLVSFEGDESLTVPRKVDYVRDKTQEILKVIQNEKEKQLKAEKLKLEMELKEKERQRLEAERKAREVARIAEAQVYRESAPIAHFATKSYKKKGGGIGLPSFGMLAGATRSRKMSYASYESGSSAGGGGAPPVLMKSSAPPPPSAAPSAAPPPGGAPAPAPAPVQQAQAQQAQPAQQAQQAQPAQQQASNQPSVNNDHAHAIVEENITVEIEDYTKIPSELDSKFDKLDEDSALHSTILKPGTDWSRKYQDTLITPQQTQSYPVNLQESARNQAFDLLDSLTKSGALTIEHASLHVVLAATHSFDKTLLDTLVKDNVNPIEKVERSTLIIATTIHRAPAEELIKPEHLERVKASSPKLFEA